MNQDNDRRSIPPDPACQPLRLLVVEDDADYCSYIAALTRRLGFRVDTASDGEAALARLQQAPYDMAVIDHEMPKLKGIATIQRIRGNESSRTLYTVMLTAHEDMDTKLSALTAGFDDFMTKSASEAELSAKLIAARRLASRHRSMDVAMRDLYDLATRDDLTGVFNRRYFMSEAEKILAAGDVLSVLMIDLDGFKKINDRFGHTTGDRVLRDVATALQGSTRPEDIVARLGGDEFAIAVPRADPDSLAAIAVRLTQAIEILEWVAGETTFRVGASAGTASSRAMPGASVLEIVATADRDMYRQKQQRVRGEAPKSGGPEPTQLRAQPA